MTLAMSVLSSIYMWKSGEAGLGLAW